MRITIIDGHPDPSPERLDHALADRYARRAREAGHDVRCIEVAKLGVPVMRTAQEFYDGAPPAEIAAAQRDIAWAQHLVFVFPLWMSDVPAVMKAFMEQTFRPGFAVDYTGRFPRPLLKGRSARIIVTMGMPAAFYRVVMGAHLVKLLRHLFASAGLRPVKATIVGGVMNACARTKRGWFDRIDRAVEDDAARQPRWAPAAICAASVAGVISAGYLANAAASWSRYGCAKPAKEPDTLLDRFMPDYEVVMLHATVVNAPSKIALAAIRISDLERSPFVRLLFGMREVLLGAKHDASAAQTLPFEKLTTLGWSILSSDGGKEIVLGTVAKPWERNPGFLPVGADRFAAFTEPGYAKIALSIRVDDVSSEHCEIRTETCVQTLDPISRARFRRYWAFLSPGMDVIRRMVMQQVRANAESAWEKTRQAAGGSTRS